MKSYTSVSLLVLAMSFVSSAATAEKAKFCKFAPENELEIEVGAFSKAGAGIDEKTYNQVIDQIEAYYIPFVKSKGKRLKMNRLWKDKVVNATAYQSGGAWQIDAFGGLARYPIMTSDAFSAVMCHEMGHHLGGFPRKRGLFGDTWASNEGQADYFATMKCFRLVHQDEDNVSVMTNVSIPKEVKKGCENTFKSAKEIALCQREAMAGQVLAQVLYELGRPSTNTTEGEPATAPSFKTPSTGVVTATNAQHPLAQCRLDTYLSGAICGISATEEFGKNEGATGACAEEKKDTYGFRPRCWYKPRL